MDRLVAVPTEEAFRGVGSAVVPRIREETVDAVLDPDRLHPLEQTTPDSTAGDVWPDVPHLEQAVTVGRGQEVGFVEKVHLAGDGHSVVEDVDGHHTQ
jgi:hypothetical protein